MSLALPVCQFHVKDVYLMLSEFSKLTEHADDVVPVVSNSQRGCHAGMLAQPYASPTRPTDGLHHGDVEEGEQEDGKQEEEDKRQLMDRITLEVKVEESLKVHKMT